MKCNIAQDLLPLYAEGLCSEETSRELEQHFAECKECSALKNGLPLPEKGGEDGLVDELIDLRRAGLINHFGVVTESPDVADRVVRSQAGWETLQFPFNVLCGAAAGRSGV